MPGLIQNEAYFCENKSPRTETCFIPMHICVHIEKEEKKLRTAGKQQFNFFEKTNPLFLFKTDNIYLIPFLTILTYHRYL